MANHDYKFTVTYKGVGGKRVRTTGRVIANNIAVAKRIVERRGKGEEMKIVNIQRVVK